MYLLFYLLLGELSAALMSEKGRKNDRLKEEFNGTNWATWHLAMQGPMHVAKATALAFEGKERPEEPANENNAAKRARVG